MARLMLRWALLAAVVLAGARLTAAETANALRAAAAAEERLKRDVTYLASDELEGRGVSTRGINLAADYIAAEFQKAGLKAGVQNGNAFQAFTMKGPAVRRGPSALVLRGPQGQVIELEEGKQFVATGLSGRGKLSAPVVFAGYGITSKETGYDEYKGLDVKNKVVVVLRKTPRSESRHTGPFPAERNSEHAALVTKYANAQIHGAAAILYVNDHTTASGDDRLMDFGYTSQGGDGGSLPALHVRRAIIDRMLANNPGTTLAELEKDIDRELTPRSTTLTGWTATIETNVERPALPVKNVIGVLEGHGPLANETVVVGAHYDHLGYGGRGSLLRDPNQKAIHHGADDNASGTTALLELARRYGAQNGRIGRRLVFIAFSAEESGLLGSQHYVKNPIFPLKDTVAMVNLDMVGRLRRDAKTGKDRLLVEGSGTAKTFEALLDDLARKHDFTMTKQKAGYGPSDHDSFYSAKPQIPVIFFWTGDHPDYHKPSDTADKINVAGLRRIVELTEDVIDYLTTVKERPEVVSLPRPTRGPGPGGGPTLGIRPGYGEDVEGVLVGGVTPGRPAAKAGIQEGDLIVEIGGRQIKNLEGYMVQLRNFRKGDTVDVAVIRGGKKMMLKVTLE